MKILEKIHSLQRLGYLKPFKHIYDEDCEHGFNIVYMPDSYYIAPVKEIMKNEDITVFFTFTYKWTDYEFLMEYSWNPHDKLGRMVNYMQLHELDKSIFYYNFKELKDSYLNLETYFADSDS